MASSQTRATRFDIEVRQGDDEVVKIQMPAGFVLAGWTPKLQCRDNSLSDPLLFEGLNWTATEHATAPYWLGSIPRTVTAALTPTDGDDLGDVRPQYTYNVSISRVSDGFSRTIFAGTVGVTREVA